MLPLIRLECRECKQKLSFSEFSRHVSGPGGFRDICKTCANRKGREWYAGMSEVAKRKHIEKKSAGNRKRLYDIPLDQYLRMLLAQKGVCAICKQSETTVRNGKLMALAVDHNHETKKVRALLCSGCNKAVGCMKEDPERLEAAAAYIREHGG